MERENVMICKCKQVSLGAIEDVLHRSRRFDSVEKAFDDVQLETGCSTGCGQCHSRILDIISQVMDGSL
jgi:NAD(P)H-nitrite reductase large subunit